MLKHRTSTNLQITIGTKNNTTQSTLRVAPETLLHFEHNLPWALPRVLPTSLALLVCPPSSVRVADA
jgi:hypothetical protein